jgi:hypothetical protein
VVVDCYGLSSSPKLLPTVFIVVLKSVDYLTSHFVLQSRQQHHILAGIPFVPMGSAVACVGLVCISVVVPCWFHTSSL